MIARGQTASSQAIRNVQRRAAIVTELLRLKATGGTATLTEVARVAGFGRWPRCSALNLVHALAKAVDASEVIR